jgi:hypothetical protein
MGEIPAIARVSFPLVDVRDVAIAHVRAIEPEFIEITNG